MTVSKQILVVDDEVTLVQLCQMVLLEAGFQVRGAYNGRQALRLIAQQEPDVILLDLMMPGIDGFEVCRQVRNLYNGRIHILLYTADDREETRRTGLEVGATDVLTKDIPVFELPKHIMPLFPE